MKFGRIQIQLLPRDGSAKSVLCKLFGHKLEYAGHGGDGDVYECVRERNPMPEKYWSPELVAKAR